MNVSNDITIFDSEDLAVPPIEPMLVPRPTPASTQVGHLGQELWTQAAMFAPQHLSEIPDPETHFQNLHLEWMQEILQAEKRIGRNNLGAMDEAEIEIRNTRPWANPELLHPIWDGTSDGEETEQQMIPHVVLTTLERYRQLRQSPLSVLLAELDGEALELAVMLLERNGSLVLDKIQMHRSGPPETGTPIS